ncbi:hypothetical protein H702_02370 [Streptococcus equinus JB1]|uniref:Bacteriocin n=1 Tax=Streptococcus equinus JB1 TaxID=1294274 RepID=A0A091BXZ2_STREI|nr:bacteriocin class II family protein [Streptococcus equinus]KFN88657.1 hypothetical protein H702_02370 [Streptococcus equinus JB1]
MNTKTIEQFNTMTTEELARVEGGKSSLCWRQGKIHP